VRSRGRWNWSALAVAAAIAGALRTLPVAVRLDRLRFFGGRAGVLAWAVDGGGALRELQAQVWSALDGRAGLKAGACPRGQGACEGLRGRSRVSTRRMSSAVV
jgi:hypothetical protein